MSISIVSQTQSLSRLIEQCCDNISDRLDLILAGGVFDISSQAFTVGIDSHGTLDRNPELQALESRVPGLSRRISERVRDDYHGKMPIGAAGVLETGSAAKPFAVFTPTCIVPGISEPLAAYHLAFASVTLVRHGYFADGKHLGQPIGEHVRGLAIYAASDSPSTVSEASIARQVCFGIEDAFRNARKHPWSATEVRDRYRAMIGA